MFSAGFSLGRGQQVDDGVQDISVSSRLTRSNSRLPSSMVIRRWLLGTLESSHAMMVVLPEPVEPAIHTLTPYRMQAIRKWSISAVRAAGIQQLLFGDCLLVDDTDRGVDAHIRVYNGRLIHRDTDVFVQKAHHTGHGVVNDHAAGVEHTAHHINGVLRGGKLVRDLDAAPAGLDHFDVVVGR